MATNNQPTHKLFVVEPGNDSDERNFWHQIGVGWQSPKGVITIRRFANSVSGEEVLLPADYKKE